MVVTSPLPQIPQAPTTDSCEEAEVGGCEMWHVTRAPIEFTNIESYSIRRQIESNRIEDINSNSGRIEQ